MTLDTDQFGGRLKQLGFDFYSAVPCSFLNSLINYAINECRYISSHNEGDAVAVCSGAYLAGQRPVVLMQNSGLTNAASPLTSLNHTFDIPILGFVSLRGESGLNDEPQHELMGGITEELLTLMQIDWQYLSNDQATAEQQLLEADKALNNGRSFFFIVRKHTFAETPLKPQADILRNNTHIHDSGQPDRLPLRHQVISTLADTRSRDTLLLATTGKAGRELFDLHDSAHNFYMVGSMGCVSALGLGLALNTDKPVIAVDGDGALLMRLGNLATNSFYKPDNLFHLVIDNGIHCSTGGQKTVSDNVDFVSAASSLGYPNAVQLHSLQELEDSIRQWQKDPVPTFACIHTASGTLENLGRPTLTPGEIRQRFMEAVND